MACTANGAVPGYLFPSSDRAAFCLERIYAAPSPSSAAPKHPTHPTLSPSSLSTTVDHSPISRTIVPSCHPDMISLSISASSSHVDLMSGPPSLRYQASLYSTHSHSYPYRHGYRSSRNTSLEQLVPKKRVRFEGKALPADRTHNSKRGMSSNGSENGGVAIERKMSYGIGGAGNIRRFPSRCSGGRLKC